MTALAPVLQEFFTHRLIGQRQASPHTVAAYRDCFRLLFAYVAQTRREAASELSFADLDAGTISGFLPALRRDRGGASPPATPGWPRSARCSPTPRSAIPSTPR